MYKLFAFLFFSSVTTFFIFVFSKQKLPTVPFVLFNALLYFGFLFYVILTSFFKSKYFLSDSKLVKSIKNKYGKTNLALDFIGSFFTVVYLSLVMLTIIFIFVVFIFPVFRSVFVENVLGGKQTTTTADTKYFNQKFSELNTKISNLEFANFVAINKPKFKASDQRFSFEFEPYKVSLNSGFYKVSYNFNYCDNNENGSSCLTKTDVVDITGKIVSFDVVSENLNVMKDKPIFVMSLGDESYAYYRIFYVINILDPSSEYKVVNPSDVIGYDFKKIISITADKDRSSLTIKYQDVYDNIQSHLYEFSLDEQGSVVYSYFELD
ncbi:MAG: hypothetical protein UT10_C0031G0001 [Candidatus Woesebacteria bacterium GW2011_GWB1_38_8b]|uniref:Uncharacterized protein n=1 Tax=Candidatus Woesebacteria bacterium GW2011_GWB1_38_8b TaxID=1618571 RepID=A0A0G0NJR3_9BACT|nr:MAG: hypothetical protein UT10_C0031G0001 [Candidatus Woesebacteria bacterium GW2011_GWB1_38_8b]